MKFIGESLMSRKDSNRSFLEEEHHIMWNVEWGMHVGEYGCLWDWEMFE
jgi:hypothetical protein